MTDKEKLELYRRTLEHVIVADNTCKDRDFADIILAQVAEKCRETLQKLRFE